MDDLVKLLQTLLDHGLVGWTVFLVAFWIFCSNFKSMIEGVSVYRADQKRVDGEERRLNQEFEEAAERRTKRASKAATNRALSPPAEDQKLLPAPTEKPIDTKASSKRRPVGELKPRGGR